MGFFRRDQRPAAESFLSSFNAWAVACVVVPLVILASNAFRGGGHGGDWFREDGSLARGLVYFGSLAVFYGLVRFVNGEIDPRPDGGGQDGAADAGKAKTVLVALVMFAILCFFCVVLIVGMGQGGAEELGRAIGEGRFVGTMFLTFLFWLVWSLGFSFVLRQMAEGGGGGRGGQGGDENTGYVGMPSGRNMVPSDRNMVPSDRNMA